MRRKNGSVVGSETGKPVFFPTAAEFRDWLKDNHAKELELVVGFRKIRTGKPSLTWPQAVEEAIAFGWIDGVRHSLDPESYTIRFTPRKQSSTWSTINIATAKRLIAANRMSPAGLSSFESRGDDRSAIYSYEQRKNPKLSPEENARIESDSQAWDYFQARPPSYRRTATWWVISAKMKETRARRLNQLIDCSKRGRPIPPLVPRPGKK